MDSIILSPLGLRHRIARFVSRAFGTSLVMNKWERAMRCAEEALELAQAEHVSEEDAMRLLKRVYSRPIGEPLQEGAGLGVCWLVWTLTHDADPMEIVVREIERVEALPTDRFKKKQNEKAMLGLGLFPEE